MKKYQESFQEFINEDLDPSNFTKLSDGIGAPDSGDNEDEEEIVTTEEDDVETEEDFEELPEEGGTEPIPDPQLTMSLQKRKGENEAIINHILDMFETKDPDELTYLDPFQGTSVEADIKTVINDIIPNYTNAKDENAPEELKQLIEGKDLLVFQDDNGETKYVIYFSLYEKDDKRIIRMDIRDAMEYSMLIFRDIDIKNGAFDDDPKVQKDDDEPNIVIKTHQRFE